MKISTRRRRTGAVAGALMLAVALASCDLASIQVVSGTAPTTTGALVLGSDISDDGSVVVFGSARVYDAADQNGAMDIFVSDRNHQAIKRVSTSINGGAPDAASNQPAISGNGQF